AVMLAAWVTNDAATSALRPYVCAYDRIFAVASFVTFLPSVPDRSPPDSPIGVDAPTFVPGAIAATGADIRMNAPADVARAPISEAPSASRAIRDAAAAPLMCFSFRQQAYGARGAAVRLWRSCCEPTPLPHRRRRQTDDRGGSVNGVRPSCGTQAPNGDST